MSDVTPTPRFVLSLTDTHTKINGPGGDMNLNIGIGADSLSDFTKPIPFKKRKNAGRSEVEAMLLWFQEQVDESDRLKED